MKSSASHSHQERDRRLYDTRAIAGCGNAFIDLGFDEYAPVSGHRDARAVRAQRAYSLEQLAAAPDGLANDQVVAGDLWDLVMLRRAQS